MSPEVLQVVLPLWFHAFLFTLAVEIPIFILMVRRDVPVWRAGLAGAAGTCFTHPALWFLWSRVISDYTLYIISGELLVAAIESVSFFLIARPSTFAKAIAASFVANAASYGGGLIVKWLTG
jgi:hypothetical protein